MKAILKYPGAKNRIADWICSYIPQHDVYLDPFGGSLAVFLNKGRCHIETVNDMDDEIVNFFIVLRDYPDSLRRTIILTPYTRSEYELAFLKADNEIERARRFCVRCWMGFGCGNLYRNPAKSWDLLPEVMMQAAERLKGVQIENLPALELLKRYNTPDVFIYAYPPYLHGTRKNYLYKYEMEYADHVELLEALLNHPGKVLLSGYDNELYNDMLTGWRKEQISTQAEGGLKRTETLWMNYRDNQMSLIDIPGVMP